MAWTRPLYSKSRVDKAGRVFVAKSSTESEVAEAAEVLNNWRDAHAFPLNTIQIYLRSKAKTASKSPIISQRLKRMESIERKLISGTNNVSQMQDIGGCRAVVHNVAEVNDLVCAFKRGRDSQYFKNEKNYIENPKDDGYRSYHLIYRYRGRGSSSPYDGLQIETQIRTQLQHAWATAVEAVSIFTRQALKWQGGDEDWKRFFAVAGSALAEMEGSVLAENAPKTKKEISSELRHLMQKLKVTERLKAYNLTLNYAGSQRKSDAKFMLVHLVPETGRINIEGFRQRDLPHANMRYRQIEDSISNLSAEQVVLVKVDSLSALQKAYPSYFLDTQRFIESLRYFLR